MGILSRFMPAKAEKVKAVQFHPGCIAHAQTMIAFLEGRHIQVLNPNTQSWEDCPEPIFDPECDYRVVGAIETLVMPRKVYDGMIRGYEMSGYRRATKEYTGTVESYKREVAALHEQLGKVTNTATPTPVGRSSIYERGQVWRARNGALFLILANKNKLPGYNPLNDPDTGPIVVMRYDEGRKRAVSTRLSNGAHGRKSEWDLMEIETTVDFGRLKPWSKNDRQLYLTKRRGDDKPIRLCLDTFEVLITK